MKEMLAKLDRYRDMIKDRHIFCFTSDIDWASEYAIEQTLLFFQKSAIPLTVFTTHRSQVISDALAAKKIQVGLHPNFLDGSSQGGSSDEIINFCFDIVPGAISFRSHRYYDSNDVLEKLYARGIRYDSNVCTLLDNTPPFLQRNLLIRFPIFFEDGAYLLHSKSLLFGGIKDRFSTGGIKIINIHPMHLMINTPYFLYTRNIKDTVSREEWNGMDDVTIKKLKSNERGISNIIDEIIEHIHKINGETVFLHNLYTDIQSI